MGELTGPVTVTSRHVQRRFFRPTARPFTGKAGLQRDGLTSAERANHCVLESFSPGVLVITWMTAPGESPIGVKVASPGLGFSPSAYSQMRHCESRHSHNHGC